MTRPTASITANVSTYSVSATANVKCGATKKKSKAATLASAATTDGPRPYLAAMAVTATKYVMTRFGGETRVNSSRETPVASATAPSACA